MDKSKYHFHHGHKYKFEAGEVVDDIQKLSIWRSFKHRFPWLFIGLVGGVLAAKLIEQFEFVLSKNLILAAFIPTIVYMADAVGVQMESFIIRDLALEGKIKFHRYFVRQFTVVFFMGLVFSGMLFLINWFTSKDVVISFVLSLALFIAIMSSLLTGLMIPYVMRKSRIDPANVSGPIVTIVQDILSIVIYFLIAAWLL
ncbi:MAG: magnesium transporter [Candidatus Gracilibacteria bacterium]|jgi:magnesium transporter